MTGSRARARGKRRWSPVTLCVLIGILVATAALATISASVYDRNESRLLKLRAQDAAGALSASLPALQTTMALAGELAETTMGNIHRFREFIAPYVGPGQRKNFVSASLWRFADPRQGPLTVVGTALKLNASRSLASGLFARAARTPGLSVIGLLRGPRPAIGYAFVTPGSSGRFVIYAERTIPTIAMIHGSRSGRLPDSEPRGVITSVIALSPNGTVTESVRPRNGRLVVVATSSASRAGARPR